MQPAEWFTITRNRMGASKFYLRSPFRDTNFVATTFILFADFLVLLMLAIRYRAQLSFYVVLWLLLGVGAMIFAWLLAVRAHQHLHLLFETRQIEKLEVGSNLDAVLSVAAIATNQGLFFASLLAMAFLGALGGVLQSR
jgi:hypothetical protein